MNPLKNFYNNPFIILAVIFLIAGILLLKVDKNHYWLLLGGSFAMIGVIIHFRRFVKKNRNED